MVLYIVKYIRGEVIFPYTRTFFHLLLLATQMQSVHILLLFYSHPILYPQRLCYFSATGCLPLILACCRGKQCLLWQVFRKIAMMCCLDNKLHRVTECHGVMMELWCIACTIQLFCMHPISCSPQIPIPDMGTRHTEVVCCLKIWSMFYRWCCFVRNIVLLLTHCRLENVTVTLKV